MNKKINILKKFDSIVGPFAITLVKALFRPRKKTFENPSSFLFIRPGGIGDAVLLMPAIKELKKAYPNARIDILCEKRNHEIFKLCSEIHSIFLYDNNKGLITALKGKYDVVIDSEQWYRLSAIVAYLTRAPIRIGFATNNRKKLFTETLNYKQDEYEIYSFFSLISSLATDAAFNKERPFISIPSELSKRIKPYLSKISRQTFVAILPGASVPEKRWGTENFHKVAVKLTNAGYTIVAIGGNSDYNIGKEITDGMSDAINLCGSLSLTETAALLSRAALLITGDSGIMHVAFGVGTPTLSLFGPGDENKWAPRGNIHQTLSSNIDCRPCTKFGTIPPCKQKTRCMTDLDPERVFEKAIKLLER